ncbi:MAG: hypothetical protein K2X94_01325 [Amoebophilaceae bacterium]|nr:hypothetical protein [Amoebophilaceae bacterium]
MKENNLLYHFFVDPMSHGMACLILAYLLAPTQFVKVVYQETKQPYLHIIKQYLAARNFKIFFSGARMYALRQFIAAFAFGISHWLYLFSISCYAISNIVLLVVWQSFVVAVVETVITIYTEMKEIAANKGDLMKRKEAISAIITPIFLRNFIAGSAPVLACEVSKQLAVYAIVKQMGGICTNTVVCILVSIVISTLSIPFDLIATQNCGSAVPMTWIGRLRHIIMVEKKCMVLFNGLGMRIMQIIPYSIAHSLIIFLLD